MILLPESSGGDLQNIVYRPVEWNITLDYGVFYHLPFSGPERGLIDLILDLKKAGHEFIIR